MEICTNKIKVNKFEDYMHVWSAGIHINVVVKQMSSSFPFSMKYRCIFKQFLRENMRTIWKRTYQKYRQADENDMGIYFFDNFLDYKHPTVIQFCVKRVILFCTH